MPIALIDQMSCEWFQRVKHVCDKFRLLPAAIVLFTRPLPVKIHTLSGGAQNAAIAIRASCQTCALVLVVKCRLCPRISQLSRRSIFTVRLIRNGMDRHV